MSNNTNNIILEIEEAIKNGPSFAQSSFQTANFVVAKHGMEARSYRQVLLALNEKLTALRKAEIAVKRTNAQINKLNKKLDLEKDENEQIIISCDIEDMELDLKSNEKLLKDAINDCNALYHMFKQLPKMTNDDFEAQEYEYWKKRLLLDAELSVMSTGRIESGTAMSLVNIGINPLEVQTEFLIDHDKTTKKLVENKLMRLEKKEEINA